jgi:hypothetical protein
MNKGFQQKPEFHKSIKASCPEAFLDNDYKYRGFG